MFPEYALLRLDPLHQLQYQRYSVKCNNDGVVDKFKFEMEREFGITLANVSQFLITIASSNGEHNDYDPIKQTLHAKEAYI